MPTKAYRSEHADGFVVEFCIPKRLKYLSETYELLREELEDVAKSPRVFGYSIYEVDGAFLNDDKEIMEDRTLFIRVFFDKRDLELPVPDDSKGEFDVASLRRKVLDIMSRLAKISKAQEKEIWTFRYDAHVYKLIKAG